MTKVKGKSKATNPSTQVSFYFDDYHINLTILEHSNPRATVGPSKGRSQRRGGKSKVRGVPHTETIYSSNKFAGEESSRTERAFKESYR